MFFFIQHISSLQTLPIKNLIQRNRTPQRSPELGWRVSLYGAEKHRLGGQVGFFIRKKKTTWNDHKGLVISHHVMVKASFLSFFFWHLYGIYRRDVWCVYIILWIWRGKQRTYLSTDGYTYLQRSFKYLGLFVSVRFFTLGYLSLSGILDRRGNRKVWGGFRCWTFIDIIWDSLDFWEKDLSQWPHHKWLRI